MRRIGRAILAFFVGYVVYLVLIEIFVAVMGEITGGYPETLTPIFWPLAAPFLVQPSRWGVVPVFDNVCSIVGALIVVIVAGIVRLLMFGQKSKHPRGKEVRLFERVILVSPEQYEKALSPRVVTQSGITTLVIAVAL